MRNLIMWNVVTLDGYFEGEKAWDLDFHNSIWGKELEELSIQQLHAADYLVFGRKTYEGMADYWKTEKGTIADLMNAIPKLIVSRTLQSVDWNNSTLIGENASAEISRIKSQGNRDMYVFGSADLSETLINDNLFDEYRIGIAPVILGKGRYLFANGIEQRKLSLIESQPLDTGGVVLKFKAAGNL